MTLEEVKKKFLNILSKADLNLMIAAATDNGGVVGPNVEKFIKDKYIRKLKRELKRREKANV